MKKSCLGFLVPAFLNMVMVTACAPLVEAEEEPAQKTLSQADTPDGLIVEGDEPFGDIESDATESPPLTSLQPICLDDVKQGGLIVCKGQDGDVFSLNGKTVAIASKNGLATIGLSQHANEIAKVSVKRGNEDIQLPDISVKSRFDDVRNLTGLDCDKVDARTAEQKAHAGRSWTKKVNAFATFNAEIADEISFQKPAKGPYTSPFGPTRHYSGVSKETGKKCKKTSVHRGLDMASLVGTDLNAPMAGTIILADEDLYYEGGTIFLDHGYGLVSVFMHLSTVDVEVGQVVHQGERIGATGNTGRTTGPHLHWAVKWRNQLSKDRKQDFYIDPALLLEVSSAGKFNE